MHSDSTLPSSRHPEPRPRPAEESHGYVLLVESDRDLRDGIAELLRVEGFGVVAVEDGLDALLQMFTGEPAPDVVVFDDDGPGMSGGEFRDLVRRHHAPAAVPLILLASRPADDPSSEAEPHFQKPCLPEALVAAVAGAVRRPG